MPSLLVKVRQKMSIAAHRRMRNALDGEHGSVFKGRSMDFDDLREYIPGDDIKDIEWRATARSGQVRVKRYVAVRKHNIMLVVDTGRSMAATAPSGECKRDIAVLAAGVVASVAQKHGDLVALTAGDSQQVYHFPLKGSRPHVERILTCIDRHAILDAPASDLTKLLDFVRRTTRRRMLMVIISDNLQFLSIQEQLLQRLAVQHELLFIAIEDIDPGDNTWKDRELYDVNRPIALPSYVRRHTSIEGAYQTLMHSEWQKSKHLLDHMRISTVRIDSEDAVVNQIVRLLEEHKHARR